MAQYKLKLDSLDLQNLEKREVEVEGIEKGKVLLVKIDDKVHALSSNCTHYGAPLIKGVLTPDGRLTCAWHGACFKVATGDVEDAPALDPLGKFPISEKDGSFYITADEAQIKGSRGPGDVKCQVQGDEKVVIVGGGSGTIGALEGLRKGGFKGHITVISLEPYPPIDRTKLSKAMIPDASKIILRNQTWLDQAGIVIENDNVSSVDFGSKTVHTSSGKQYPYTKLILATGGTPRRLPLPGFKDLNNVFTLRTVADVQAILGAVGENKNKNIVVVGSSFIGLEVANCLSKDNSVTVIGMESAPLERVMGAKLGRIFQSMLEKSGIKFHMSAGVEKATPSSSNPQDVGAVHLKDGTELPCDLVVLGVGVAPATEYLKDNPSITLEKDGSLRTDASFLVEGFKDVYAIGDIATHPYLTTTNSGKYTRIEHWNVAQNGGRTVGALISGSRTTPKPFTPIFWSALGKQLRYCGNTVDGYDDIVFQGKPEESTFAAFYTNDQTVVAVATMQMDPVMTKSAELMRRGKMPGKKELQEGLDVLGLELPGETKL
ncbi:MAG: hypothetical protein M1823_003087 [Watsoniomyces obsoletus]|nr:MAG: hypothetical protein M1823_003087 [Watsoniomyces obsoletus]